MFVIIGVIIATIFAIKSECAGRIIEKKTETRLVGKVIETVPMFEIRQNNGSVCTCEVNWNTYQYMDEGDKWGN